MNDTEIIRARIKNMRSSAKRDGKYVPTPSEIRNAIPSPFLCPACGIKMNWKRSAGAKTQATLQHDRSGDIKIICASCNSRHHHYDGDSFYDLPQGKKRCSDCKEVLSTDDFFVDKSTFTGRKSCCKACSTKRVYQWRAKNQEAYRNYMRRYRACAEADAG